MFMDHYPICQLDKPRSVNSMALVIQGVFVHVHVAYDIVYMYSLIIYTLMINSIL